MRHANRIPRYVSVASGLGLAGLGLAIAAIGGGPTGLTGLTGRAGEVDEPAVLRVGASTAAVAATAGDSIGVATAGLGTSATPGTAGRPGAQGTASLGPVSTLTAGPVLVPAPIPAGTALDTRVLATRPAEAVQDAQQKDYVPFTPTSIRLPSGRPAPIQPAAVAADGALDVPADPDRIGWWTGGAQAGEPYGGIVLAGHVDSARFGIGVLAEMLTMRPGQNLKLADGRHGQVYRVQSVRTLLKADLSAGTDLFRQDVRHRLVLITCGGPFDRATHRYRDNVVIVATPVG